MPIFDSHSELSEKRRHELHFAVMTVAFALLIAVVGVALLNKKMIQDMQGKTLQVNSLIEEIGELKEENLQLYQGMQERESWIEAVETNLNQLQKRINAVDESGGAFALQKKVEDLNKDLQSRNVALERLVNEGSETAEANRSPAVDNTLDILILGTHGKLTDTIMLASINEELQTVTLISIPRDLAVDGRRINEYWHRFGIDSMRTKIQEMTGLYPEKYVVWDMKGFETFINSLGGIDVQVEKDLYDSLYPGPNFTYEVFSLKAGEHHMDGLLALKYARSRKSSTDFERAKRQQQIIEAVKGKILGMNPLEDMDQWINLYSTLIESVQTDLQLWDIALYLKNHQNYTIEKGNVLSNTNHLYTTTGINGAYLLLPKGGNYEKIKVWIQELVQQ